MVQTYVSPSNTYSFEYPDDWKLEREDGGTLSLKRKSGLFKKESLNTLRITPMVSDEIISPEAYTALLNIRKKEHQDLQVIDRSDSYIMNFHILKYRREVYQDFEKRTLLMIQDFWELIISNRIFTCSFTSLKDEESQAKTLEEKSISEKVLFTIRLL